MGPIIVCFEDPAGVLQQHVRPDQPLPVIPMPNAASGVTTKHHLISVASTNATSVKAAAAVLYQIVVNNLNAAARYLKIYDKASAPVVGTDVPVLTIALPPGQLVNIPLAGDYGMALANGLAYALTAGIADTDVAAVAASEHAVNLLYK